MTSPMVERDVLEIELRARRLHAAKCHGSGIHDADRIALYWEGCDQAMYLKRAAALQED
jgi:hypothetical protein